LIDRPFHRAGTRPRRVDQTAEHHRHRVRRHPVILKPAASGPGGNGSVSTRTADSAGKTGTAAPGPDDRRRASERGTGSTTSGRQGHGRLPLWRGCGLHRRPDLGNQGFHREKRARTRPVTVPGGAATPFAGARIPRPAAPQPVAPAT